MDKSTYTYQDGSKYEGEMKDGRRNGKGIWIRPDGMKYEGEWKNNKPDGYGKLTMPDGSVREGYWKQGKFLGKVKPSELEGRVNQLEQDVQYLKQELDNLKVQQPEESLSPDKKQEKEPAGQDMKGSFSSDASGPARTSNLGKTVVQANDLTKKFGRLTALNNVNLEVKQGEVYGFIGPNGAGKTTAIRIMLGILKPTQGWARVFGMDAWKDAVEIHRNVAYVPGEVNLWPELTGGEVIDLFIRLRGANNHNRREELIQKFDLDPSKKCGTYSKGNRQKVALVAAFASDADLYILDEPSAGLDPLMDRVFRECVMEARQAGKTIFLSSHILSEVERLCDKVSIIRQGEIIETGYLKDLRHLTRTSVRMETRQPVPSLDDIKGVHNLRKENQTYSFQVDTEELDSIIKYISQFDIIKLESAPPTLEDLFMRHYEVVGGDS